MIVVCWGVNVARCCLMLLLVVCGLLLFVVCVVCLLLPCKLCLDVSVLCVVDCCCFVN